MNRIFAFGALLFLLACQSKNLPTYFKQDQDFALVKFSFSTTKDEMIEIQKKLKGQGLEMDFTGSEFFEDGKLRNLKLKVTTPSGSGGMASADQVTLQFKYFGFKYDKVGDKSFLIGEITEEID
jgi:hypothetical protein